MKTQLKLGMTLLCFVRLGLAEDRGPATTLGQPGRYHVVVAPLWNPVEGQSRATLIKIDSATGRVWILRRDPAVLTTTQGDKITVLSEGWSEIDKTFAEAVHEIKRLNAPSKK